MKSINKALKANIKVTNMAVNQFEIITNYGAMFRSYDSNIAFIPHDESIIYLGKDWDFSKTTAKYRNMFLGCNTNELKKMIKDGKAIIVDDL